MAESSPIPIPKHLLVMILFLTSSICITGKSSSLPCPLPPELASKLHNDPTTIISASTDYGNIIHDKPAAVLYPSSIQDIQTLVKASYNCSNPFGISIKGNGHSVNGQNMARNGVVVDMKSLRENNNGTGIRVSENLSFADVGGEQLWIDVLNATTKHGVSPVSWTDFLYLTVGGTLSNAGVSGQAFLHGPQISNVYELDVINGKGELVTCSRRKNSELFDSVLGGLGQFGIITRARIVLRPAPKKVRWLRALYSNFSDFTGAQERIIRSGGNIANYLEGSLLLDNGTPNAWITSFFPSTQLPQITSMVKKYGIVYVLELVQHLKDDVNQNETETDVQHVFEGFAHIPFLVKARTVSYQEFLLRVPGTAQNVSQAHPWQNLFIPKSRVLDFNSGALRNILLERNISTGPLLFYPTNRNTWDGKMSAVTPDEDIFYIVSLLHVADISNWETYEDQNKAVVEYCDRAGIKFVQYLHRYTTREEWINHFGPKWTTFQERKAQYDPKHILSPGQKIFD